MTDTLPQIRQFLESIKLEFKVIDCDPKLADTNVFCREYNINLEDSVNAIIIKTKKELENSASVVVLMGHLDNWTRHIRNGLVGMIPV